MHYLIAAALLSILLFPDFAYAQTLLTIQELTDAAQGPPLNDSLKILSGILGEEFATKPFTTVGEPSTTIGKVIFIFNSVIFLVGSLLLGHKVIEVIVNTAAEGLAGGSGNGGGQGAMMPVRLTVGVVTMIPAFGGYSAAQALMMTLVTLGVGGANIASTTAIDSIASGSPLTPPVQLASQATSSIDTVMQATQAAVSFAMCASARDEKNARIFGKPLNTRKDVYIGVKRNFSTSEHVARWDGCGTITLPVRNNSAQDGQGRTDSSFGYRLPNAVDYKAINDRAEAAAQASLENIARGAEQIVRTYYDIYDDSVENSVMYENIKFATEKLADDVKKDWKAGLTSSLPSADATGEAIGSSLKNLIKTNGWMQIGSWFGLYSETSAAVADGLSAYPISSRTASDFKAITNNLMQNISVRSSVLSMSLVKSKDEIETDQAFCVVDRNDAGECSVGQTILKTVINATTGDSGGSGLINPIIAAKNLGDWMMMGGQGIIAGAAAAELLPVGKIAGTATKFAIPDSIKSMSYGLAWGMIIVGMLLSLYIPLIPFLIFTSAVIVWLFATLESLLTSQIWAMSHILPSAGGGSRFVEGAAAKGYATALNMLLRPIVLVIAFFLAAQLVVYVGSWFTTAFFSAIGASQGNSVTGLLSILGLLFIYAVAIFGLAQSTFTLLLIDMPNRLLGALGESGGSTIQTVAAAAGGAFAGASGANKLSSIASTASKTTSSSSTGKTANAAANTAKATT